MTFYLYNNSDRAGAGKKGFVRVEQKATKRLPLTVSDEQVFAKEFDSYREAEKFNNKLGHRCMIFGRFDL